MIVHKSRKRRCVSPSQDSLAGIAGGLILYYVRDAVSWLVFRGDGGFTRFLYGIGSL